jgi:NAD(P)-dependent dehydrogenase (short-subunit alcohol dehydrogenase family)
VAAITGGSRGIGREIVLTFAREGTTVGVNHFPDETETAPVIEARPTAAAPPGGP